MDKRIGLCFGFLLLFFPCLIFSDSEIFQLYKQNFTRSALSVKAQILENASYDNNARDFINEFYDYALQFAVKNSQLLKNDPDMVKIISISLNGLKNTGDYKDTDILWDLFTEYHDTPFGAEILIAAGKLAKGNASIIEKINNYLMEQNNLFKAGSHVNYATISACIAAVLELGDSSSYSPLFAVICADFPEVIAFEAQGAFDLIPGNIKQFLMNVILKNPPEEKLIAFKTGIDNNRLSPPDRGQIAELALEQSFTAADDDINLTEMRYASVKTLVPLKWTRANTLAIRHYYRVQTDYQHDNASKENLLDAIALLGTAGNTDAALTLALQLGLVNIRMEKTGNFDREITLAIVNALGLIGDKDVFDHLLQVSNLPYTEDILAAAKEAIDRLKW
ncbi:MAG: hypothetical protein LBH16_00125 [Treponema sp.]|jgi:hypothetical protein|nr:hypothetical protein [Treponema sp.]